MPNGTITSATVTCGDGASSAAIVVLSGNLYNVCGTHTYTRYGTYAGTVSGLARSKQERQPRTA